MKKEKTITDLDKKRGNRLQKCRKMRKKTQEELAILTHYTTNYISMLENGIRKITTDKAKLFGKMLNVCPEYILCETDIIGNLPPQRPFNETEKGVDYAFFEFLIKSGYTIEACVIPLYDDTKEEYIVSILELTDFNLSSSECTFIDKLSNPHQSIITGIILNENKMPFSSFQFLIDMIYRYIGYTLDNSADFQQRYELYNKSMRQSELSINKSSVGNMSKLRNVNIYHLTKTKKDIVILSGKPFEITLSETGEIETIAPASPEILKEFEQLKLI